MSSLLPPLSPGDVLLQKYEIDFALGGGPVGRSYTARMVNGGKRVVVKVLHGPAVAADRLQATAARLEAMTSDDLIRVLDHGVHNGQAVVVTEYFEGESLRRLMDEYAGQRKPFTLQESAQLVARVLEACDAAHRAGLVHRQIKPQNVLVASRSVGPGQGKVVRTVRVTGLGLAELVAPSVLSENMQERPEGRYVAPELTSPGTGGSPQSDIYSAGVLFYELLTGQAPSGTYLSPSQVRDDLPERVDGIVDIALAANAEDRYPTVRDMINDIQRSFTEDAPAPTGRSNRSILAIIGGVAVIAVAALAGVILFNPQAGASRKDAELRAQVIKENPVPDAETIKQKLVGHDDMVYIPAGTFIHGRMNAETGKSAAATEDIAAVQKTGAYYIDRFEWPNQKGENPMIKAGYDEAAAACSSVGKRLCSDLEWERACKGPENLIYGYSDTYDPKPCGGDVAADDNHDNRLDRPSGSLDTCKSAYGAYDLSGGAREWTSTSDPTNPRFHLVKGGKLGAPQLGTRCAYGEGTNPTAADRTMSFRCCLGEGQSIPTSAPAATP